MNTQIRTFVGLAAIAAVIAGLWIGLSTRTFDGRSCGSAFDPKDNSAYDSGRELGAMMSGISEPLTPSATEGCESELDGLLAPAILLIVVGVLGNGVWLWREPDREQV